MGRGVAGDCIGGAVVPDGKCRSGRSEQAKGVSPSCRAIASEATSGLEKISESFFRQNHAGCFP